jgi:hypothetical protein
MSKLHAHVTQSAETDHANFLAVANWDRFYRSMQRALPKQNANLELNLINKEGEPL